MTFFLLLPAALSLLVLAAHFVRADDQLIVVGVLSVFCMLLAKRNWARILIQVVLFAGAIEWMRVMLELMEMRQSLGMPYIRMAVIIGSVAGFSVLSAVLMRSNRVVKYFNPAAA